MDALFYENLIRRVFDCGRTMKNGAEADIYRKLEMSFQAIDNPNVSGSKESKEYHFRGDLAVVRSYVSNALKKSLDRISGEAEDKIKSYLAELTIDFYDKDRLDQIIKEANQILMKEGLTV